MLSALILALSLSSPGQTPSPAQTPAASPSVSGTPTPTPTASPSPLPTPDCSALVAEADAHFARRAIGAIDEIAPRHEIDAAIEFYKKALAVSPRDIAALAKLMRALHFKGAYTGAALEEKKAIFDLGRTLGQEAVDRLEAEAKETPGFSRIEALRLVKGAPALYLWTAGHWGEWGLARGKFAAARSGLASRLRDLAQTVIDLDPTFEDAAGYRILGRLHAEAPKIPLVTGWVSHEKGVQYLRRAHEISPSHPVTAYFLAEAILDQEPEKREEALRLLEQCANTPPRPDSPLEDSHYARVARRKLDSMRGAS
jgi:tetratricopeptide (TPR) repeat protein